ncbi:hypothetical protein [Nostoc sp. FACHB-280]|uniref:hypothetical protein n=1 Tax=Nostoc sp. FACHB-280 TaxID=2692839 RepID=UPI00168B4A61|nr:hypothetical protein [Nostoc sp. FACHB-280]MBD2498729.1 hypothetical protein [Nostoc sp. FACHB-280]
MDITISTVLNWAIEVTVMGFVSLIVADFVNGLFWLPYSSYVIAPVATTNQVIAAETPHTVPAPAPQFAQLPSPWDLDTDITPNSIPQPVVLEFPTLKLLPPAASAQPKARTTTKSTKSTQPKSTKTSKTSQPKTTLTPRKSRKKSAA